jgi:hypothetical protein
MKNPVLMTICQVAALLAAAIEEPCAAELRYGFDLESVGGPPIGWAIAATNPGGPLAEWRIQRDSDAPSPPQVLTMARINDDSGGVFNLCWTRTAAFRDGVIEVSVRADSGAEDQGGGLMWRARDADNYYVARYNPLERNLRLYFVKDGKRKQLASAEDLAVKSGVWFRLRIVHHGDRIEAYLDGRKHLELIDRTFTEPGGIGFWSKADAASSFDDLVVTPLEGE